MSWAAAQKRMEAARKREERASLKRQRELERMLKEQAKLSAAEQARLEVEAFEIGESEPIFAGHDFVRQRIERATSKPRRRTFMWISAQVFMR